MRIVAAPLTQRARGYKTFSGFLKAALGMQLQEPVLCVSKLRRLSVAASGEKARHNNAAINHLVFRKSICPSLLGLVGDAQMVEYIDIMANREAYPEARECPLRVINGPPAPCPFTSAVGG